MSEATQSGAPSTRVSPAFMLVQTLLINAMAKAKVPTNEIAQKLKVNRSYVIRLTTVPLAAESPRENELLALATNEYLPHFQRLGLKGLLSNQNLTTTLAGGERPKLGPLEERRAAKAAGQTEGLGAAAKAASNGDHYLPSLAKATAPRAAKAPKRARTSAEIDANPFEAAPAPLKRAKKTVEAAPAAPASPPKGRKPRAKPAVTQAQPPTASETDDILDGLLE